MGVSAPPDGGTTPRAEATPMASGRADGFENARPTGEGDRRVGEHVGGVGQTEEGPRVGEAVVGGVLSHGADREEDRLGERERERERECVREYV